MPSTPYAKLLAAVNGASPVSGGLTVAVGDVIQLSAESTVGWTQQRYEIWSGAALFPLTVPAGWSTDGTTGAFFYSTTSTPPPFTVPAGWGKLLLGLRVNDGADGSTLADFAGTALQVLPTTLIQDIAWGETTQFSASEKWIHAWRADIRLFNTAIGGGIVPTSLAFTATAPLRVNGGASADLTGPQTWSILASTTPTAAYVPKWGAGKDLGAAFFYDSENGVYAAEGLVRIGEGGVGTGGLVLAGLNTGVDKALIEWAAGTLIFGEEATTTTLQATATTLVKAGSTTHIRCTSAGIQLCNNGAADFGGGVDVVGWTYCSTAPTTAPTTGMVVYATAAHGFEAWSAKKVETVMAPVGNAAATAQLNDHGIWVQTPTTDATPTVGLTYSLPNTHSHAILVLVISGQTASDTRCAFELRVSYSRNAGNVVKDATETVTTIADTIGVAGVPTASISGTTGIVNVIGKAGPTNITWTVTGSAVYVCP